jgi:hypothetical protein
VPLDAPPSGAEEHDQEGHAAEFGAELSANTIEGYLGCAREALLADIARGRQNHRANSLGFYESVLADSKAAVRDKVKA